jgi:putative chitinase
MLKIDELKDVLPANVYEKLPKLIEKFKIETPLRLAHFLSQCSHESGHFKNTQENLNYSVEGLLKIFPKYFTAKTAPLYARNPVKIANKVYGNRMGNGAENSGEGYKYRGRGYLQCTGKSNYAELSKYFDVDFIENPELIAGEYALLSAGWFFEKNKLFSICDKGATEEVVTALTKRINGGTIGLPDRIKEFNKFYKLLS